MADNELRDLRTVAQTELAAQATGPLFVAVSDGLKDTERPPAFRARQLAANEQILRYFDYSHLPPHLAEISRSFCELALRIFDTTPRSAERSVAFRKLLESKDAAVRALITE